MCSLLRNSNVTIDSATVDYTLLNREEEKRVVELLVDFPQAIIDAGRLYDPNMIANHLLKLTGAFNSFYQRKNEAGRTDKIISDDKDLTLARIALVKSVQLVVKEGLYLLGIQAPEEM